MRDIKEIAKEMTREEFLNWYDNGNSFCPSHFGLPSVAEICVKMKCLDCIKDKIKDITFKGDELTAICINDKTQRDRKIKVLGITEGKEYQVKPSRYANYYELVNDMGNVETYFMDRFKKIEPKPVTTAEAFKALDEGKIIESVISKDKYKKINGIIHIEKEDGDTGKPMCMFRNELEGQWIIIEGDK